MSELLVRAKKFTDRTESFGYEYLSFEARKLAAGRWNIIAPMNGPFIWTTSCCGERVGTITFRMPPRWLSKLPIG